MSADPKAIAEIAIAGVLIVTALPSLGRSLGWFASWLAPLADTARQRLKPAPAQTSDALAQTAARTAGDVLDSFRNDLQWLKDNTDATQADIQPIVETLAKFLTHDKPKAA